MKNDVKAFFLEAQKNEDLSEKIKNIAEKIKEKHEEEKLIQSELIPLAKEFGFEFTIEDYKKFIESEKGKQEGNKVQLDVMDLENVSGGGMFETFSDLWILYQRKKNR